MVESFKINNNKSLSSIDNFAVANCKNDSLYANIIRKAAVIGIASASFMLFQQNTFGDFGQPLQKTNIHITQWGFSPNESIRINEYAIPINNSNYLVLANKKANSNGTLRLDLTAYALNPFNKQCVIKEYDALTNKRIDEFVLNLATKNSSAKIGQNIRALSQNLSDYSSIMLENNRHPIKIDKSGKTIAPSQIPAAKPFFNFTDPNANKRVENFKGNKIGLKERFIELLHSPTGDISMIVGFFAVMVTLVYIEMKVVKMIFRPFQRK